MSLPILLVTGFLGAGKTTLINRILAETDGRRIAAVVNDFGSINIDEALIAERTDTVIGLANGCICCSLQGDLLRTLKLLVSRPQPLDNIVIEASGVADPHGIVEALADPELWAHARLSGVVAVADAQDLTDDPARFDDPLWAAQIACADFVTLVKTAGLDAARLRSRLAAATGAALIETDDELLPLEVLLDSDLDSRAKGPRTAVDAASRFVTLEWQGEKPGSLQDFQRMIEEFAPTLVRAKGLLNFAEMPGTTLLFQMVGRRATLMPCGTALPGNRLVLIGERHMLDPEPVRRRLARVFAPEASNPGQ
ncbi:MAG: GTP-binding protein [Rhizobiaceae bacterium]|nr:GTP-binding protein [Rhizobiaceae bacterium]